MKQGVCVLGRNIESILYYRVFLIFLLEPRVAGAGGVRIDHLHNKVNHFGYSLIYRVERRYLGERNIYIPTNTLFLEVLSIFLDVFLMATSLFSV